MSDQEARHIVQVLHERYRFRSDRNPPSRTLLANSANGTNLRLAMLQFAIEMLVRGAVSLSEGYAADFAQPRHGLSGWELVAYRETPAGSTDPVSLGITFLFRFGDPDDPARAARAGRNTFRLRVTVTRIDQHLWFYLGEPPPGNLLIHQIEAGIFPGDGGVVTIVPDPSAPVPRAPAGRPRSTSAPHAPSRP